MGDALLTSWPEPWAAGVVGDAQDWTNPNVATLTLWVEGLVRMYAWFWPKAGPVESRG